MTILAGIDEAGFGPLLGPLVVSSCAFAVGLETVEGDLWQVLRKSVGRTRKHLRGRLLVADSKKAYKRAEGLGHLERSVLSVLGSVGERPADLGGLLSVLCPDCLPRLIEYPWYRETERRLLPVDRADLRIAGKVFADDAARCGVKLVRLASHCLDVAHYNTLIGHMRNKAQVLFVTTTRLVQGLLEKFPGQDVHILIDRQGGRVHYREHLLRSFSEMDLRILVESERRSAYELRDRSRVVRMSFEVGADERRLPVSLASMVSKYVRELLMERVNRYFAKMSPDLKPTAG
ncbi:MAG: ribonuclease H family protein, partial [Planctomycetota bacterium]